MVGYRLRSFGVTVSTPLEWLRKESPNTEDANWAGVSASEGEAGLCCRNKTFL